MPSRLYPAALLHGRVAHEIGRQIVSGEIAEGGLLPREAELSEKYSVSRQAVREALKVLSAKGLISSRRRAGTRVRPRNEWNLLDPDVVAWHPLGNLPPTFHCELFELRRLLQPAAAAFAATRAGPREIARISDALDAMRGSVGNPPAFQDAVVEFHMAIFAASGNSLIERLNVILGPLLAASYRILPEPFKIADYEAGIADLDQVLLAIRAGDAAAARSAADRQLARASEYIVKLVASRVEGMPRDVAYSD
jgi:DNA-binding FadR family transcriptional regulator